MNSITTTLNQPRIIYRPAFGDKDILRFFRRNGKSVLEVQKFSDDVYPGVVDAYEADISRAGNVSLLVLVVDESHLLLVFQQYKPVSSQFLQERRCSS